MKKSWIHLRAITSLMRGQPARALVNLAHAVGCWIFPTTASDDVDLHRFSGARFMRAYRRAPQKKKVSMIANGTRVRRCQEPSLISLRWQVVLLSDADSGSQIRMSRRSTGEELDTASM